MTTNKLLQEMIDASWEEVPHERDWDSVSYRFNHRKLTAKVVNECLQMIELGATPDQIKVAFGVDS